MKVLIIGGVAGGASAAARLRRLNEDAEIILFERGDYISFANCGLPYYIGGDIRKQSALTLQTPESFYARFHVQVRVRSLVTAIDPAAKTISVFDQAREERYSESYDYLILSPGAEPILPPVGGTETGRVFTLRSIPDTLKIKDFIEREHPKRAAIVGGGYIGLEMAENLQKAGMEVTVIEKANHVIGPLDYDMACDVHHYLRGQGVRLALQNGVKSIQAEDGGSLRITLEHGVLHADMVLLAVGVRPDTMLAKTAGLELNARGAIVTDEHMRSSVPEIYAVGDAVECTDFVTGRKGYVPLAGPANKQGRIAADNICGIPSVYRGTQGSSVLKIFEMTVAMTGLSESSARQAQNLDYDKSFTFSQSHAAYYPGGHGISIKTLYEKKTGRILGAQLVGFDGVDKRCDVFATAIRAGMTAYDLTQLELCYAPPFGSAKDPVNFAGYAIENILTGKVKAFHWHDVADLPRDGSVTLLDVRRASEFKEGHIDGFIHIPLDDLRERAGEIEREKPVYVHCHSGLRSYIACRILTGLGYACYNLSGGYRQYASVEQDRAIAFHSCYDPDLSAAT